MHCLDNTQINNCQQAKNNFAKKRSGFDPIRRDFISDENIKGTEKIVLMYLASNSKDFNPSVRAIAKMINYSVNTVCKVLKRLEIKGYIKRFVRKGFLTIYNILISPVEKNLSTSVPISGVQPSETHRNSKQKDKQSILSDVSYNKYDLVRKKLGLKSSIKSLGFKLAKSFHGKKGYDFVEANKFYSDLIVRYGKKGYEELKKYATSSEKITRYSSDFRNHILNNIQKQIDGKMAF